ncbi:MAG: NusG domain II-containing protein [Anaerostipes sp.]|nr:NusG domain II-containing protein [Anaerostipes sp.]
MKKKDLFLVGGILIIAFISMLVIHLTQRDGKQVKVTVDGKIVHEASLSKNETYTIPVKSGENKMRIKDGYVKMIDADCPDQICKNHKKINKDGETIVCLPHKVVIEIMSDAKDNELDGMTN